MQTLTAVPLISLDSNTIIVLFVLGLILGFIFFVYLLLRRTFTEFKDGMNQGR
jgi:hypothetical protein